MFILKVGDKTHQITKDITKIGRHTSNDIVLAETRVSRFHSEIVLINGRIFLLDKKTVNGTFIGDKRILPDREILLKPDDNIGIGCAAGELGLCTLKVEHSSDETPPNEDNEVVSTTNDSDSDENVLNGPEDDEYRNAYKSCEESPERLHNAECPVPPQTDAKELERRPLPPSETVSKPANSGQSSSRQPETSSPQVKLEPAACSPDRCTNIPSSPSPLNTNPRVKQPPEDDLDMSDFEPSIIDPITGATLSSRILNDFLKKKIDKLLAEKLASSNILPSLPNVHNQHAASSLEISSSQTSNASTNVNEEPSVKVSLQPSSSERKGTRTDSKKSNPTSTDVPTAVATAKVDFMKVDLSEEPENDVMEITDVPPAATNEPADRVSRCASKNDVNESVRKQPTSSEPTNKNVTVSERSKCGSKQPIIDLCDGNEGTDDVIEISDEESDKQPRRRQNRKTVDPNPIVIEDTRDDEDVSNNLEPGSDRLVTTAPALTKPPLSEELKVDLSEQTAPTRTHKVEVPQPVLTTPAEPPPYQQSRADLQTSNAFASVGHTYSNVPKVESRQPVDPDPVNDSPCNQKQVLLPLETATNSVKLPTNDRREGLFLQPIISTCTENSSIDKPNFGFPQSRVEPISRPSLQEPVSYGHAENVPGKMDIVVSEEEIPSKSPLTDAPHTSSFLDLSDDRKLSAIVKSEPLTQSGYSNFDEIVALDSDDEDFPLSQLNTTQIDDVPDFSSVFERIFDDSDYVKEEPQMLQCNENTWFEPFSQTEMVEGKHVARVQLSTLEPDDAMTEEKLQSILEEEPDGVVESEVEEAGDKMDVDDEPSLPQPSPDPYAYDENEMSKSTEWRSVVKRKYQLKDCSIRLTDAQPLNKRRSRKESKDGDTRHSSSSFDEAMLGLNEEAVRYTTTKKRHAQPSPHKVKKRKRKNRSPTMSVQEKKLIKEMRKEKLKEIAPKANETHAKWKDATRPDVKPVVKVTDKNRGSYLIDTMIKETSLPKRPAKVDSGAKEQLLAKGEKSSSKSEPSTSKHQSHSGDAALRLPVTQEEASHSSSLKSSEAKLAEQLLDRYCNNDAQAGPSRRGSICEPEDNAFARAISRPTYKLKRDQQARKNGTELAKKSTNATVSRPDSRKHHKSKSSDVLSLSKKPKKSSLKKTPVIYGSANIYDLPKPKKKVRFQREHNCQIIECDALERRNNGIFAPAYKLNENLIREGVTEFEMAMAKVCSWNVKWLEEQQKCFDPPPLYPESDQLLSNTTLTVQYKEELKLLMFSDLWQAIFRSWNKPDNDFLPYTQFINEKTSHSTLTIESVDTTKTDKKMWTLIATRTVPADDKDSDLSNGQVVILNFPIMTQTVGGVLGAQRKTMAFSYLVAVSKTYTPDKQSVHQRMMLRISAKPFHIVLGKAKLKVLNYLRPSLRPFQALAMITRSPLTDLIIDPKKKFYSPPHFDASSDWFTDKFLDMSQRKAVANCLNCIISPEPSLCLVDGAPGTGKSQIIVSLMRELFSKNNRKKFPNDLRVLIVTAQEVVADDLTYRLESLSKKEKLFKFLRYGNHRNMHAAVKNCTLDKKIQDLLGKEDSNQLINLDEEKNNLKAKIHSIKLVLDSTTAKPEKISEAKIKLTNNEREWNDMESENSKVIEQLKSQVAREISIEESDIILTSVYSCWTTIFEHDFVPTHHNKGDIHKFTVCIFDDASLINEVTLLVPMMLMVRSLILVGDQRNQIIINKSRSPFCRLLTDCAAKAPSAVTELNYQYRSPPHITQWVDEFYDIRCKPPRSTPAPAYKLKIKSFFVFDLPLPAMDDTSYRYETQAQFCTNLVEKLNELVDDTKIRFGVIVAHTSQKDIIKGSRGLIERGRKMIVETLEEFSGREHGVVILCLPYHCSQYASWLYLAVTRASRSLFVCGDFSQLQNVACVNSLAKFARSRNLYSRRPSFDVDIPSSLILSSS